MKNTKNAFLNLPCLILIINIVWATNSHYIPKIKSSQVHISSYVNQAKQVQIPFKKCFEVETDLPANHKYIQFQPSTLKLQLKNSLIISQNRQISVLQDLRSPRSYTHQNLIVLSNYAIAFKAPNILIIMQQNSINNWQVTKKIQVKQINENTQFKIYKFQKNAIMLLFAPRSQYQLKNGLSSFGFYKSFLITKSGYFQVKIPIKNSVAHFQANGKQLFTAEYRQGIRCYSYSEQSKSAIVVAQYSNNLFNNFTKNLYLVDINIRSLKTDNIIYALDGIKGVFRINLTQSLKQPKIQLVVAQPNCNAMDSMNVNHLVLVCQLGSASYIVQSYANKTQTGEVVFTKLQPQYHVNYFNDLEINKNYFLVFSHRILNVYWSSKENNIPETVNTRSQLDLPGLQTFYFKMNAGPLQQSFLYVIQSGVFKQYLISQSQAKLLIKSSVPIQRSFKLSIFGNCQDLPQQKIDQIENRPTNKINIFSDENLQTSTCELQTTIRMRIVEENSPRKQDFSVSASIIVILIVIFLLIIWICLKKYKGLQRQARKVLDAYKRKRNRTRI